MTASRVIAAVASAFAVLGACAPADGADLATGEARCRATQGFLCAEGDCAPIEDTMSVRLFAGVVEACSAEHGVCVEDGVSWDSVEPGPGGQGRYRTATTERGVFSLAVDGELAGGFTYSSHQFVTAYVLMGRCDGAPR